MPRLATSITFMFADLPLLLRPAAAAAAGFRAVDIQTEGVLAVRAALVGRSVLLGAGLMVSSTSVNTYLVDCYPKASASIISTNNLFRYLVSASAPIFVPYMIAAMGNGWTQTFFAALNLLGWLGVLASSGGGIEAPDGAAGSAPREHVALENGGAPAGNVAGAGPNVQEAETSVDDQQGEAGGAGEAGGEASGMATSSAPSSDRAAFQGYRGFFRALRQDWAAQEQAGEPAAPRGLEAFMKFDAAYVAGKVPNTNVGTPGEEPAPWALGVTGKPGKIDDDWRSRISSFAIASAPKVVKKGSKGDKPPLPTSLPRPATETPIAQQPARPALDPELLVRLHSAFESSKALNTVEAPADDHPDRWAWDAVLEKGAKDPTAAEKKPGRAELRRAILDVGIDPLICKISGNWNITKLQIILFELLKIIGRPSLPTASSPIGATSDTTMPSASSPSAGSAATGAAAGAAATGATAGMAATIGATATDAAIGAVATGATAGTTATGAGAGAGIAAATAPSYASVVAPQASNPSTAAGTIAQTPTRGTRRNQDLAGISPRTPPEQNAVPTAAGRKKPVRNLFPAADDGSK
ncbi:hypothetical protein DFJ74DRAFT_742633 [Hyaloraphidium curvatum]|nr:hypothetical protein DFJ74DRAFT_742633 [Hyaloraphidium curvatum]